MNPVTAWLLFWSTVSLGMSKVLMDAAETLEPEDE
jgi:hypothetical protein